MPTTVIPSFTGSVATSIQGINVNSYERFGRMSGLPLIGRSHTDKYYISSSDGVHLHTTDTRYFDETFRFASPIGKGVPPGLMNAEWISSGSIKQAHSSIGDDNFKIIPAPSFVREENLFGISKDFEDNTPFKELQKWDSVQYLIKQDTYQWPVVLDSPGALSPFDYNGVIEPLAIRKVIAGTSTFLDSIEDPEPHSVKGDMDSTDWIEGSRKRVFHVNEYYSKYDLACEPWEPVSDRIFDSNELTIGHDATYASFAFLVYDYSSCGSGTNITIYQQNSGGAIVYLLTDGADNTIAGCTIGSSNTELATNIVNAINNADKNFKGTCRATLAGTGSFENQVVVLTSFEPGIRANSGWITFSDTNWAKHIGGADAGRYIGSGTPTTPGESPSSSTPKGLFKGATGTTPAWVDDPLTGSADGGQWYSQWSLERFIKPLTYVTDHTSSLNPWRDRPGQEELFKDIRDPGIRSYLEGNSGAMTLGGRPNVDSESAGKGFTFEHTEFGIDSIAFGGRKK